MTGEGASGEEDFAGFNIHNKDACHETVSMFEKLNTSNPECEVSQVDVEVWTDAGKGIAVSRTEADGDLVKAVGASVV